MIKSPFILPISHYTITVSPPGVAVNYLIKNVQDLLYCQAVAPFSLRIYFKTAAGLGSFIRFLEENWGTTEKNAQKRRSVPCQ